MNTRKCSVYFTLVTSILLLTLVFPACTKKRSQYAGVYAFFVRGQIVQDEGNLGRISLKADGTVTAQFSSSGGPVELYITGDGTWKESSERAVAVINITTWQENGKTKQASRPLEITFSKGVRLGRIYSNPNHPSPDQESIKLVDKNGGEATFTFSSYRGNWQFMPQ